MTKKKSLIKKVRFGVLSLVCVASLSLGLSACKGAATPDDPVDPPVEPPAEGTLDLSTFDLWDKTQDTFDKETSTITFNHNYGGALLYFNDPLSLTGYNYIEIDYTSNKIYATITATYADDGFAYNGLPVGSHKVYVKIDPTKTLRKITIQISHFIPYVIKINSIKLVDSCPAYLTTKVVDSGSKTFNDSSSAMDYVKNLTIGWNLGNSLESVYYGNKTQGEAEGQYIPFTTDSDVFWGVYPATKETFKTIKDAGFDMVRIPVTWYNHVIDNNYTIDPAWMYKVKQTVDWALDAGLYVMLNEHHSVNKGVPENAKYGDGYQVNKTSEVQSTAFLKAVWKQICEAFNNGYDEHLMFEVLNEPRDTTESHKHAFGEYDMAKNGCAQCAENCQVLVRLNQACVDTIRASGGNNAKRYLVIPALSTGIRQPLMNDFTMPTDTATDKLILAVHDYYYCLPEEGSLKDTATSYSVTDQNKQEEEGWYTKLNEKFMSKGIPIILTETACNYSNSSGVTIDRGVWYDYLLGYLANFNGRIIWWDNGGSNNGAILNRETLKWECPDNLGGTADTTSFVTAMTAKAKEVRDAAMTPGTPPSGGGQNNNPPSGGGNNNNPPASNKISVITEPVTLSWATPETTVSINFGDKINSIGDGAIILVRAEATDFSQMKFVTNDWQTTYTGGNNYGLKLDTSPGDINALYFIGSASNVSIIYLPDATTQSKMKTDGFILVGNGVTVKSVDVYNSGITSAGIISDSITHEWTDAAVPAPSTVDFSTATANSCFVIKTSGDNTSLKLLKDGTNCFSAGELSGEGGFNTAGADPDPDLIWTSQNGATVAYFPTSEEWETIKATGISVLWGGTITSFEYYPFE